MKRRLLKRVAGHPLATPVVSVLERAGTSRPNHLRAVTYHDVRDATRFVDQLRHLATRYRVVSMGDVLDARAGRRPLPPRAALITFDDAYQSVAELAWPALRALGLPAVLFVPTGFPDAAVPFWWDRLEHALATSPRASLTTHAGRHELDTPRGRADALRALKQDVKARPHEDGLGRVDELCRELDGAEARANALSWDELRRLTREGLTLGAHTRTHPRLDRVSIEEAEREIRASLADLEREIGQVPPVFAYPDGAFDDDVVNAARRAGVELAFTTRRGTIDLAVDDPLRLRRVHAVPEEPLAAFRARLAQSSVVLNRWHAEG